MTTTTGMPLRRRATALALALVLALAAPVSSPAADFLAAYDRGVEALERGDAAAAAEHFRAAIAERPEESAQVVRRLRFRPYLPHFQLGRALLELGDCPGALAAWGESERQGVIQRRGDYVLLREGTAICRDRLREEVDSGRAIARAEAVVAGAERAVADLARLADDPDLAATWDALGAEGEPSAAERTAEVERLVARAGRELAEARAAEGAAARSAAERAIEAAAEARRRAGEVAAAAEARLRIARRAKDRRQERIDALRAEAQDLLFAAGAVDPESGRIARARARLENLLAESRGAAAAPLPEVARLEAAIRQALDALREAAAPPPAPLETAAAAWLAGDPDAVVAALDGREWRSQRTRAHATLLLAAAHHALARARPGGDPEHLAAARRAADACRAADPGLEPIPSAFSPAFRKWFAAGS